MTTVDEIISYLEEQAPLCYQENYDNSGLITGNTQMQVTGIMICLDSTEAVLEDAIANGCNMIISHHPIVFSGIKSITGKNYIERTIIKAIKNDIAIYAIHTNLDNVAIGVNQMLSQKLGLTNLRILAPRKGFLKKLVTFCPLDHADKVREALFVAGAGSLGNYSNCSFNTEGTGTFKGNDKSNPHVGQRGQTHCEPELRIEVIFEGVYQKAIIEALRTAHPYEEVAYDIYSLDNVNQNIGAGMVGDLPSAVSEDNFLKHTKTTLKAHGIRHTKLLENKISRVAVCGGAGVFLLSQAIASGAQAFVTSDVKYHQFFDADDKILLIDAGHYETEQYTLELLLQLLNKKFVTFAIRLTKVVSNPVNYL